MSDIKKTFGRNLTRLLEEHHETQVGLAEKMHVAPSSVSGWCTGTKMPRMDKVEWIASYFNVSRSDLLEDSSSNSAPLTVKENTSTPQDEHKRKLRSVARLESADITPELDRNITRYIDFLLNEENKQ